MKIIFDWQNINVRYQTAIFIPAGVCVYIITGPLFRTCRSRIPVIRTSSGQCHVRGIDRDGTSSSWLHLVRFLSCSDYMNY